MSRYQIKALIGNKSFARMNVIDERGNLQKSIRKFIRMNSNVVYGARSINAQANIISRPTNDWDIFSSNPKRSANQLQRVLDKLVGGNYFYSKPAQHKGTWKVKSVGADLKAGTRDDQEFADFTKPEKKVNFVTIKGIRYRALKEEIKAKQNSLNDQGMKFRHGKDRADLERIKSNMILKKIIKERMF